jgi:hypothetical protein
MSASNASITNPVPIGGNKYPQQQIKEQANMLSIYETSFRKIKDAIGVSNVNEVIRKIVGQESTTENLRSLTVQNQSKMEELASLQDLLWRDVDKIKYNGVNSSEGAKMHRQSISSRRYCTQGKLTVLVQGLIASSHNPVLIIPCLHTLSS